MDAAAMKDANHPCAKSGDKKKVKDNCKKTKKPEDDCTEPCKSARRCMMVGYPEGKKGTPQHNRTNKCCDDKTAHHAIPFAEFAEERAPGGSGRGTPNVGNYDIHKAPCMCLDGVNHNGTTKEHARAGKAFALQRDMVLYNPDTKEVPPLGTEYPYEVASNAGADSVAGAMDPTCDRDCLQRQIDDGHRAMNAADGPVRRSRQFGGGTTNAREAMEV
jgi:hypothetical protein